MRSQQNSAISRTNMENHSFLKALLATACAGAALAATDPLQQVVEDQTAGLNSSATIFNRNIAHKSMVHYSHASDYRRGFFGQHAHDGLKTTHWGFPAGIPSATLEIFWGLATEIDRIDIYEAGSNIQAYQLEIHDGKAWREIHAGKAIGGQAKIEFAPCLASAVRLRIDTDSKGGGIQELEVYHTASTEALPRYGSTRLVEAFKEGKLKLPDGAMVMVEAVSEAKHGEIVALMELPADRKVRIRQPAQSAMLLTVSTKSLQPHVLEPVADSTVGQGKEAGVNKGGEDWLGVRRHSDNKRNAISYLKFELPEDVGDVGEAALELYGQSETSRAYDGGFLIRAYVLADNSWEESQSTLR